MIISRRRLLRSGSAWVTAAATVPWLPAAASGAADSRHIAFSNLHTGERLDTEYFRNGEYLGAALTQVAEVLRDFRSGERHAIDPKLLDMLVELAAGLGMAADFSVISGYRSPATNEQLRALGQGVAQHSLHMQGRAIDVRVAAVDCADLAGRALELKRGGVGYYRASDFVHLDTGPVRSWRG